MLAGLNKRSGRAFSFVKYFIPYVRPRVVERIKQSNIRDMRGTVLCTQSKPSINRSHCYYYFYNCHSGPCGPLHCQGKGNGLMISSASFKPSDL